LQLLDESMIKIVVYKNEQNQPNKSLLILAPAHREGKGNEY